jgi:thiamine biosynthesis lipoprotein
MPTIVHEFQAMGSDCEIRIDMERPEAAILEIAQAAEAEVRRIERRYSRYRDDSELSRINRAAAVGGAVEVDAETEGLIAYAFACFEKSGGAFDVTSGLLRRAWNFSRGELPDAAVIAALLPHVGLAKLQCKKGRLAFGAAGMELDFGGLGKEYAADRAAEVCVAMGARHGLVNLGGDLRAIGPQACGRPWRVGIRHPRDPDRVFAQALLADGGLATSGDYERFIEVGGRRYCHILDPRTGWPSSGLSSVSVLAPTCLVAGSLATSAMIKGAAGAGWLESLGVSHARVDDGGAARAWSPDQALTLTVEPGSESAGGGFGPS